MNERSSALRTALAALPDEPARLQAGSVELRAIFCDLVRAYAPANPQYERERIIVQAAQPRELVFLLGLLAEGENEAALLLDLAATVVAADRSADVGHLIDEAWYYLRTSIDPGWQPDDGVANLSAALVYLTIVLNERLDLLHGSERPAPLAGRLVPGRSRLLRSLRAERKPDLESQR